MPDGLGKPRKVVQSAAQPVLSDVVHRSPDAAGDGKGTIGQRRKPCPPPCGIDFVARPSENRLMRYGTDSPETGMSGRAAELPGGKAPLTDLMQKHHPGRNPGADKGVGVAKRKAFEFIGKVGSDVAQALQVRDERWPETAVF